MQKQWLNIAAPKVYLHFGLAFTQELMMITA